MWANEAKQFRFILEPPKIDRPGNTVPKSIVSLISKIHREMTVFDFTERTNSLNPVISTIDSAIRVLENHRFDKERLERKRKMRQLRIAKLRRREQRLAEYLSKKRLLKE